MQDDIFDINKLHNFSMAKFRYFIHLFSEGKYTKIMDFLL